MATEDPGAWNDAAKLAASAVIHELVDSRCHTIPLHFPVVDRVEQEDGVRFLHLHGRPS
jgi:hypothetical protein